MVRVQPASSPNPATVGYMKSIGLNPYRILQEGVDKDGYDEMVVDSYGKAVLSGDARAITRRQWPPNFDWDKFTECLRLDGIWPGGEYPQ